MKFSDTQEVYNIYFKKPGFKLRPFTLPFGLICLIIPIYFCLLEFIVTIYHFNLYLQL